MADDTPDLASFYTDRLSDRKGDDYRAITPEDNETKWSDYGRALGSGALGIGSSVAGAAEYATNGAIGGDARKYLDQASEAVVDNMTPVAKRALSSSFIPDEGETGVLEAGLGRALALKVTSASPSLVASIVPAGVVGAALRGASLATRVGAASATARTTNFVLNAGDVVQNVYGAIDKMSDQDLAQQSNVFAGYLSMGMDPKDARQKYMRDVAGVAPILTGAVSAMIGGSEVDVAKLLAGAPRVGLAAGARQGAKKEFGQEIAETFTSEMLSAQQLADAGLSELNWQKVLSKTIEGGVVGGLIGGGVGGVSNIGGGTRSEAERNIVETSEPPKGAGTGNVPPPPTDVELGNTVNPPSRSETSYGKKGAKVKAVAQARSGAQSAPGVQVIEGPVGATEAAAMPGGGIQNNAQATAVLNSLTEPVTPEVTPTPEENQLPTDVAAKLEGLQEAEPAKSPTVPEPVDTLKAQLKDLADGVRDVMMIPVRPKNAPKVDLPVPAGFESVKLSGKGYPPDTRGTFYYNPASITPDQIKVAAKAGKLNDLLNMGPTDKATADADVEAGATPLAVQLVDESGTPKVEQGTSSATVQEDAAAVAAQGRSTDTTKVTTPQKVLAQRVEPNAAAEPAPASAPEQLSSSVPRGPRILESVNNAKIQREIDEKAAVQLKKNLVAIKKVETKAAKVAQQVVEGRGNDEQVGQYATKDKKQEAERVKREGVAKAVFDEFPPSDAEAEWQSKDKAVRDGARTVMAQRVAMAIAKSEALAREAGVTMPTKASPQMSNENLWLLEAKRFLNAVGTKGLGRNGAFNEFTLKELDYRKGDGKVARADRREGGDTAKRKDQGDVEAKGASSEGAGVSVGNEGEFYRNPQQALEAKEEEDFGPEIDEASNFVRRAPPLKKVVDEAKVKKAQRRVEVTSMVRRIAEKRAAEKRAAEPAPAKSEEAKKTIPATFDELGAEKTRLKNLFKDLPESEIERRAAENVADARKKALEFRAKQKAKPDQPAVMSAQDWLAANDPDVASGKRASLDMGGGAMLYSTDENGALVVDEALQDTDVKSIFANYDVSLFQKLFGRDSLTNINLAMFRQRLTQLVGDVPVYVVDPDSPLLNLPNGKKARGYYDTDQRHIILSAYHVMNPETGSRLIIHEATHAAFEAAIEADPTIKDMLERMRSNLESKLLKTGTKQEDLPYGLTDIHEFISEAFSNPVFQRMLANTDIDPAIAAMLDQGLGVRRGQIKNYWDMFLEMVRFAFKMKDNSYTMLDATLRIGRELDQSVSAQGGPQVATRPGIRPSLDTSEVKGALQDRSAAVGDWAKRSWAKVITGDQMRQQYENTVIGPALKQIWDAMASVGPTIQRVKERGDELAVRHIALQKKHSEQMAVYAELAEEARMLGVSMEGNNDHLGKDQESSSWQAKKRLPALQAKFAALPEEVRQLYRDSAAFYRDAHNRAVQASVNSILHDLTLKNKLTEKQVADLTTRVMDQKMTDPDKVLLGDTVFDALENAAAFHRVKGDYFPLMRFGDHVVTTEDKIKDTMGGNDLGDGVVEFSGANKAAARRTAKAFAESTDLLQLGRTKAVLYDRTTGKRVTTDEAKSLNDVETRYQVKVQTRGAYFFDSAADAQKFVRTNPEGHDVVNKPELRMGAGYAAHLMSGTQMSSLIRSIDQRGDIKAGQKELLKSIVSQAAIRMAGGNRIASRRLKAQKVTGASTDLGRVVTQYNTALARHIATAESMPLVRDGLRDMENALQNYAGNDRPQLKAVQQEVIARVDQGIVEPNEPGKLMKDALAISFLARLFSPMHSIINSLQPMMVALPILGGRFGNARASAALGAAYGDIGLSETAISGFMNTVRAAKQFSSAALLGTDDIVGNIRKKLSGDLGAMFDTLMERGAIDANAGMEVNSAVADGRGAVGRAIANTDRIARQMPQMVEAVNRAVTAIASYKLARESGMNHEKATQFALDTVKTTQGDYSASNAPRFFNNAALRPMMQFRKYAQMMTYLIGDATYRAFKDASPEERSIARKQLMNFMAVQIAMAGALSVPGLELVKVAFLLAAALGIGDGWDDQEEKLKRIAENTFGKELGRMITSGVFTRLGGYGVDVSQRMSLSDMWLFGEPRKNDSEGMQAYLFRLLAGSSGTYFMGGLDGFRDVGNLDVEKGLGKIFPIKFAADFSKAVGQYRKGEANELEVVANTLGVKSARQAEKSREVGNRMREREQKETMRKAMAKAFYDAKTRGEKVKAAARNREWNKQLGPSEWRMRLPTNADAGARQ